MLEKAATIKRFEYSLLNKELKAQFFKDQMNIINNSRQAVIKKEDIEIDEVDHAYIGDEYTDLIVDVFKFKLKDGDLCLIEFANLRLGLKNVNNYLEKNDVVVNVNFLISRNLLKICQMLTREYIGS